MKEYYSNEQEKIEMMKWFEENGKVGFGARFIDDKCGGGIMEVYELGSKNDLEMID